MHCWKKSLKTKTAFNLRHGESCTTFWYAFLYGNGKVIAMFKKDINAVAISTIYLIIYCELLQFKATEDAAMLMLLLSPVMFIWLGYTVLRHGRYTGKDLGKEEFGYADKTKDELGVF